MGFKIPFGIDSSKFKSGLKDMRAGVKKFGDKIEGDLTGGNRGFLKMAGNIGLVTAGLSILGGLAAVAFSKISAKVKKLENQSKEAVTGIEELQVILQAAFKAGTQSEQVVAALKNIASRSVDAVNGAKQYQAALARLNIDFKTFANLAGERKLEEIAKGFVGAEDEAQAYRDVLMLLGEDAGPKLIKVLEQLGTQGFDKLNSKMKESGQIIQKEVVDGLKDAQDALDDLANRSATKATKVGGFLANIAGAGSEADIDIARSIMQDRAAMVLSLGFSNLFESEEDKAIARQEKKRLDIESGKKAEAKTKGFIAQRRKALGIEEPKNERKIADDFKSNKEFENSMFGKFIKPEKAKRFQGVPVSSLQAIGGGGAVGGVSRAIGMDMRRNTLLETIAENTSNNNDGAGDSNGSKLG